MAKETPRLDIATARRWRSWLARHHARSRGVWLVFHKDHTGVASVPYEAAVREALCYGWIDSLIKRLDDDRYARLFTPRKPTSKWSTWNRRRWADLKNKGLLAPPGLASAPTDRRYAPRPSIPVLPRYVAAALRADPKAWRNFRQLPPSARCRFVGWIHLAKRPETRQRRIRESIALLKAGKRLGLK
jgi:uncharacterized protein YdeI (YjbR/CyaY-like superfamily)